MTFNKAVINIFFLSV